MKLKMVILLLFPFLIAVSCKKDGDEIDSGFVCKLNGKTWRPYVDDFKLQETQAHIIDKGATFYVLARNTRSREHISFAVSNSGKMVQIGTYELNSMKAPVGLYDKNDFQGVYSTKPGYEGTLEIIKIDDVLKRISGRFSFNAHNETTNESVSISNGSFNLPIVNF